MVYPSENFLMNNNQQQRTNNLAAAALVFGILGCVTIFSVVFGIFFGALALIFALLSRGNSRRFYGPSKAGLILGLIAAIGAMLILFFCIVYIVSFYGSLDAFFNEFMNIYTDVLSDVYGVEYSELLIR